jgi:ADP-ribose pyrophosphatase YjhB (NUDIX family)
MTNRKIAVRAIILHEDKILCVRLKPYEGSVVLEKPEKWWAVPGGGVDENEGLTDGLRREMIEETGVAPKIGNLLYVQQFVHNSKEQLEFFFHVTNAQDYLQIDLTHTTHGTAEIAEISFLDPATTNLYPKFLQTENLATQIQNNSPTKIFNLLKPNFDQLHNAKTLDKNFDQAISDLSKPDKKIWQVR